MSQLFNGEADCESPVASETDPVHSSLEKDIVKPVRLLVFEQKYCVAIVTVILSSLGILLALTVKDTIHDCVSVVFHGSGSICREGVVEQTVTLLVVFMLLVCVAAILRIAGAQSNRLRRLVDMI